MRTRAAGKTTKVYFRGLWSRYGAAARPTVVWTPARSAPCPEPAMHEIASGGWRAQRAAARLQVRCKPGGRKREKNEEIGATGRDRRRWCAGDHQRRWRCRLAGTSSCRHTAVRRRRDGPLPAPGRLPHREPAARTPCSDFLPASGVEVGDALLSTDSALNSPELVALTSPGRRA